LSFGTSFVDIEDWAGNIIFRARRDRAARELSLAAEASASRSVRELYSAKLDWLRVHHAR
jgi:hypothetical protein